MGVASLWKSLASSGPHTLVELAWTEGFDHPDGSRYLKLGIDASIWLFQVKTSQSEYPLQSLFYRLVALLDLPIRPLFVFDGNLRPDVKRGKTVPKMRKAGGQGMLNERAFRDMIEAFGFDAWTAPGEAEAELAYLNSEGHIDAVQTEDVDALIFGATEVYVSTKNKGFLTEFRTYNALDLELGDQRISNATLILTALVCGGDYDQKGSVAFGPTKGLALGRAGFGDKLVDAYKSLSLAEFTDTFLPTWRAEVAEELRTNASGELGRKFVANANSITDTFINVTVLDRYVNPVTSESPGQAPWPGFIGREVKRTLPGLGLADLGRIMETELNWEGKDVVLKRACGGLWEGAVRRAMMAEIESPGTWAEECAELGLHPVPVADSPRNHRMEEYFSPARNGSSSTSPVDEKKPTGPRPFGRGEFPFLLEIKKKRIHAHTGGKIVEYKCTFDTVRFVCETVKGLTNGGVLDPETVKKRAKAASTKAEAKTTKATKGRASRAVASDTKMDEDDFEAGEDEDFTLDIELAIQAAEAEEAHRHDDAFQPSGSQKTRADEADQLSDDGEAPSSSQTRKAAAPFRADDPVEVWVPLSILSLVYPDQVAEHDAKVAAKELAKQTVEERKAERARVKAAKLAEQEKKASLAEKQAALMNGWVTKGVKPRPVGNGKARADPVVDVDAVRDDVPARLVAARARSAGSARPVASSMARAPSSSQVIDISDDSDNSPRPKSPSPKPTRSLSRATSARGQSFAQPVASSSKLPTERPNLRTGKSKMNLHPCPSPDTLNDDPSPPSKLSKNAQSPTKRSFSQRTLSRTLSAASASVPDMLSDDDDDEFGERSKALVASDDMDGFDVDAFVASLSTKSSKPKSTPTTPSKPRASARVGPSPSKRIALEMERSLSPSPAGMEKNPAAAKKGKGKVATLAMARQEIFDLDSDLEATPKGKLQPFSSPPAKSKRVVRAFSGGPSLKAGKGDMFSSSAAVGGWDPMDDE